MGRNRNGQKNRAVKRPPKPKQSPKPKPKRQQEQSPLPNQTPFKAAPNRNEWWFIQYLVTDSQHGLRTTIEQLSKCVRSLATTLEDEHERYMANKPEGLDEYESDALVDELWQHDQFEQQTNQAILLVAWATLENWLHSLANETHRLQMSGMHRIRKKEHFFKDFRDYIERIGVRKHVFVDKWKRLDKCRAIRNCYAHHGGRTSQKNPDADRIRRFAKKEEGVEVLNGEVRIKPPFLSSVCDDAITMVDGIMSELDRLYRDQLA